MKKLFLLFALIIAFLSCKKEDTAPANQTSNCKALFIVKERYKPLTFQYIKTDTLQSHCSICDTNYLKVLYFKRDTTYAGFETWVTYTIITNPCK